MEEEEGDDLVLVKASATLLQDISDALPKILWKKGTAGAQREVHRYARWRAVEHVIGLIEPFQGEPQLLDARLRDLIPPLVDAYIEFLQKQRPVPHRANCMPLDVAISKLLYTFCKVRGEKIIAGFLNNEPRYLGLILTGLENSSARAKESHQLWQLRYVLMLWLWHLVLAPFDLSTISTSTSSSNARSFGFSIPEDCPPLLLRILAQAIGSLSAATREHEAAAKLLVRLVNRPDVQRLGLHETLISFACSTVDAEFHSRLVDQSAIGYLRFLAGIAGSCGQNENGRLLPRIWAVSVPLFDRLFSAAHDSSALNRKIAVKLFRSTCLTCQSSAYPVVLEFADANSVIEEVIDRFLQALSDKDTQVRFTVAKALGSVISRLDKDLAHEVIGAIIDGLGVVDEQRQIDFSEQDPQLWHGHTLSLAHALFGRSIEADQLPVVVAALVPALNFEKKAITGNSLGTNVRDAACFAIWSMSRRYTTSELLAVDASSLRIGDDAHHGLNLIQYMAVQLMLAACLDPNGNVRRGCSAALQEMIGRHPDQVHEGISLIQILDYQAVGLRRRALINLVSQASALHDIYWAAYLHELRGWRGLGSQDVPSRQAAAVSVGRLCLSKPDVQLEKTMATLVALFEHTREHESSIRHGSLLALCEISKQSIEKLLPFRDKAICFAAVMKALVEVSRPVAEQEYEFEDVKSDLPCAVTEYCTTTLKLVKVSTELGISEPEPSTLKCIKTSINKLVTRSEEPLLLLMPDLFATITALKENKAIVEAIIDGPLLLQNLVADGHRSVLHGAAQAFALARLVPAADWFRLAPSEALRGITELVDADVIEWRVIGIRALSHVLHNLDSDTRLTRELLPQLTGSISKGLADYTVTERGDVGSWARFHALSCMEAIWSKNLRIENAEMSHSLEMQVTRLSLERLDKVRLRAWQVLLVKDKGQLRSTESGCSLADVSTRAYFYRILSRMGENELRSGERQTLLKGLSSSVSTGAEHLVRASRTAFVEVLQEIPQPAATAVLTALSDILNDANAGGADPQLALELLTFAADVLPIETIGGRDMKWRTLLSRVQKSHFKSAVVPRLMSAVTVYRVIGVIPAIREEVLKKLVSMVKTNPVARVRYAAAEAYWCLTKNDRLRVHDFTRSGKENAPVIDGAVDIGVSNQ